MLLRLQQVLGFLELRVTLVPRILESEVKAGNREHLEVVEPRNLALVALVEQKPPGLRLRLHLVAAVEDLVEAPVLRDPVLLAVQLAGLDHDGVEVLEVRYELRVPGLDEPARRAPSTPPATGGLHD